MKIALYIENGLDQIVLTPENETETNILSKLHEPNSHTIYKGSFYECQGGWVRQGTHDESSIIVFRKEEDIEMAEREKSK